MDKVYRGGCDCGAVRYTASGRMRDVVICHCGQCRRTSGHVAAFTGTHKKFLSFDEDRGLKWYASSDHARRGFCGECGSSLFWDVLDGKGIGIAAGSLDTPTGLKTLAEIFVGGRSDYYELTPGIRNFEGDYED